MSSPPVTLEISKRKNLSISNAKGPDGATNTWLMRSTRERKDAKMPIDDDTGFYEPEETWKGTNFDQRWHAARNSVESRRENEFYSQSDDDSEILAVIAHRIDQSVPESQHDDHLSNKIFNGMEEPSEATTPTVDKPVEDEAETESEKISNQSEEVVKTETSLAEENKRHETKLSPSNSHNNATGNAKTGPVLRPVTDSPVSRYSSAHSRKPSSMSSSVSPVEARSPPVVSQPAGDIKPEKKRHSGFRRLISFGSSGSDSIRNAFSKSRKSSGSVQMISSDQRSVSQPGPRPLPPSPPNVHSKDFSSINTNNDRKSKPLPTTAPVLPTLDLDLDLRSDLDPNIHDALDTGSSQISTFHDIVDTYLKEKDELESKSQSDEEPDNKLQMGKIRAKSGLAEPNGQTRKISSASVRHVTNEEIDPEDIKLQEKLVKLRDEMDQYKDRIELHEQDLARLKPSLLPEELFKYSKEEREHLKKKGATLEEELAVLRKKQHEVGILYSKAWKRRRENGSSDFWVRSH